MDFRRQEGRRAGERERPGPDRQVKGSRS